MKNILFKDPLQDPAPHASLGFFLQSDSSCARQAMVDESLHLYVRNLHKPHICFVHQETACNAS